VSSAANREAIRTLFAAFSQRDVPSALAVLDPQCELQEHPGLIDAEWRHGHEGAVEWAVNMLRAFGDARVESSEFEELGPDRVLCKYRVMVRGARSGIGISDTGYAVFDLRDGKILRASAFPDRAAALESVRSSSD
jgi:ketosteroid isomerase-like protein